ncbi:MAG: hypothetical protein ACOYK8_01235 [Alphaproteobacteria bacterium]
MHTTKFQDYMQQIADKLSITQPIQFVLEDLADIKRTYWHELNKSAVFSISTGLLALLQTEDQLAALLAIAVNEDRKNITTQQRLQYAGKIAMIQLHEIYDVNAVHQVSRLLARQAPTKDSKISDMQILQQFRFSNQLKLFDTIMVNTKATIAPTPIDDDIKELATSAIVGHQLTSQFNQQKFSPISYQPAKQPVFTRRA